MTTTANPMRPYLGKLAGIKDLATNHKLFQIELTEPEGQAAFAAHKPGQFIFFSAFGAGEAPFGITSTPLRSPNTVEVAINGTTLDMQGWEGVMMIVYMGAITGSAVTSINAASGAASNMSDAADLEGTGITIADDDDEQIFVIDLYRPLERYVRLEVARATQNAAVAGAVYVQYNTKKAPVTQNVTDAVTYEFHASPAEGTA